MGGRGSRRSWWCRHLQRLGPEAGEAGAPLGAGDVSRKTLSHSLTNSTVKGVQLIYPQLWWHFYERLKVYTVVKHFHSATVTSLHVSNIWYLHNNMATYQNHYGFYGIMFMVLITTSSFVSNLYLQRNISGVTSEWAGCSAPSSVFSYGGETRSYSCIYIYRCSFHRCFRSKQLTIET